ncbi:Protein of unknown function [Propionibacterium freudenreichii]|uniref:Uncharacterized protein n=1 Tax=Propionibacterium freudenreichii subsp. freudenreichii TaxID=66712 RepID=A0A068VNV2_PROFF|nr:Protein of unknown function [Propionibacterium freudenreichii subsp. freudenreichii]CEG87534.1 Protein of unknown function [Propionibacterium freudenreichii]CEG89888.1 Protein of unknown function [Propionibacterium freudenreichii]CEG92306.1 Protein of unknown function [Propionibacterium freudenreichii]CEG95016.1 Protein of unknown function [Propionibacterium freudenreichii]
MALLRALSRRLKLF